MDRTGVEPDSASTNVGPHPALLSIKSVSLFAHSKPTTSLQGAADEAEEDGQWLMDEVYDEEIYEEIVVDEEVLEVNEAELERSKDTAYLRTSSTSVNDPAAGCGVSTRDGVSCNSAPSEDVVLSMGQTSETTSPRKRKKNTKDTVKSTERRVLPSRAARVQSFRDLESGVHTPAHLRADWDEDVIARSHLLRGERLRPAKVFVEGDMSGMHLDWPIYSYDSLSLSKIAHVIMTDAANIPSDRICDSVPQEFTEFGSFVVDLRPLDFRHEIVNDSLGNWGKPSGSVRFFSLDARSKIIQATANQYDTKISCNRYLHPGTNNTGKFSKKIYVGTTRMGETCQYAIVCYEWEGNPHPIAVEIETDVRERSLLRPEGQRSWEAANVDLYEDEGLSWNGQPVFSRFAVDFDAVCQLLIGTIDTPQHRICSAPPADYRQAGTFVVDINRVGGDAYLSKDQLKWGRPSGQSRFFRFDNDNAVRVDFERRHPQNESEYDLKILCKRYDCDVASLHGFVRKIYTCRERESLNRCNTGLAVLVYFWKGDPFNPQATSHKQFDLKLEPRVSMKSLSARMPRPTAPNGTSGNTIASLRPTRPHPFNIDTVPLPHADHLKRISLQKELENQNRLSSLLERAEAFLDRFEQAGHNLGILGSVAGTMRTLVVEQQNSTWDGQQVQEVQVSNGGQEFAEGDTIEVPTGYDVVYQ